MPDMLGGHAGPRMGRKTSGGRAVTNGYMGDLARRAGVSPAQGLGVILPRKNSRSMACVVC